MPWRSAGGCCSRSSAPSGRPIPCAGTPILTFVVVGGGPTGVEMAGAVAEIRRYALSRDFRHIDPARPPSCCSKAGPRLLATYPPEL